MKKTKLIMVIAFIVASAGTAVAAPAADGAIGVGVEAMVNGSPGAVLGGNQPTTQGISMNYNSEKFHFGGFVGLTDPSGGNNTSVTFGGRFMFHVHNKSNTADFSVGGTIGIGSIPNIMGERDTNVYIEPGFQIRAFIVPNVALSLNAGIVIGVADASGVAFAGQLSGGAGLHYYFF